MERGSTFGVLAEMRLGAVRPEGWLKRELNQQADGFITHQPEFCEPFDAQPPYWAGNEAKPESYPRGWWVWEQNAYWVDSMLRCGLVADRPELTAAARIRTAYTLAHPVDGWFLGPRALLGEVRWPQSVFFRALMADTTPANEAAIGQAVARHYLHDTADYTARTDDYRNLANIEGMLWAYDLTGERRLLDKAVAAWCARRTDDAWVLGDAQMQSGTPIKEHGVTYSELIKQPVLIYMRTGDDSFLRPALAGMQRVFDHHMLVDGIPSTTEIFRTTTVRDAHETCDITDFTWTWGVLLMATGDGVWADRIERAVFNAAFGALKKDWKGCQYFSAPNQVIAVKDSNHLPRSPGSGMMVYAPNPGIKGGPYVVPCCAANVGRILPNYVARQWMEDGQGGLAAVLYGPSRVQARVGAQGQAVTIVEETEYPFAEHIVFRVESAAPATFTLRLRVPGWCVAPALTINGVDAPLPDVEKGFIALRRTFAPGDRITLTLPMRLAVCTSSDGGRGLERGPLVYSLPIREQWEPRQEPRYRISSASFPVWELTPASAWNYALVLDPVKAIEAQVEVVSVAPGSEDVWRRPPIGLRVKARKVADWGLVANPAQPDAPPHFMPPLPDPATLPDRLAGEVETLTLAPLGSTHLRMTLFPDGRLST